MTIFEMLLYSLVYFLIGYYIARLSLEVTAKWGEMAVTDLRTSHTLRIFLFPFKSANLIRRYKLCDKITWADDITDEARNDTSYLLLHSLFWPARILWSVIFGIILFILTPLIFTVFGMFALLAMDLGSFCQRFLPNPVVENTSTTQAESS